MPRKYILCICLLTVLVASAFTVFNNIAVWLARNDDPVPADLIICLSGDHRIIKAASLYHEGWADTVLLTVQKNDKKLVQQGVPSSAVKLAPGVRTTFEEALAAREYVSQHPATTAVVISDPYHMSRVRWAFEKVFSGMDTHLVFVGSDLVWPQNNWFDVPFARYQVASEVSKMIFYQAHYGILGQKSTPEWVFKLKRWYLGFLKKLCK